ncbi:hypothetical protein AOLI_G00008180 [Acnodon oligacanthus]
MLMGAGLYFSILLHLLCCCAAEESDVEPYQDVYDKDVTTIPAVLKDGSKEVFFIGSQIGVIPKGAFSKNPQLEKVEFLGTPTFSIEEGAFEGLEKLAIIEISGTMNSLHQ